MVNWIQPMRFVAAAGFALLAVTACRIDADSDSITTGLDVDNSVQIGVDAAPTAIPGADTATPTPPPPTPTQTPTLTPVPLETPAPAGPPGEDAAGQDAAAQAVDLVFEEYRSSLLELDGQRATQVVSQSTFAHYDRILDAGLNADRDELLNTTSLSEALGVLAMRAQLGTDLLDVPDGVELFVIAVDRGLVGDNIATLQFDRIDVEGDEAFGVLEDTQVMRFEAVAGSWFLDLPFTSAFIDDNEENFMLSLTDGVGDRAQLYELIALGYGTTWDELSLPLEG